MGNNNDEDNKDSISYEKIMMIMMVLIKLILWSILAHIVCCSGEYIEMCGKLNLFLIVTEHSLHLIFDLVNGEHSYQNKLLIKLEYHRVWRERHGSDLALIIKLSHNLVFCPTTNEK